MTMSGGEERSGDEDEDEAEAGIDNDDEVETALAGAMAVDHNYSLISLLMRSFRSYSNMNISINSLYHL